MPCYDGRPSDAEFMRDSYMAEFRHNSELAQWLCAICTWSEKDHTLEWVLNIPGLATWWKAHKRRDELKEVAEKNRKRLELSQAEAALKQAKARLDALKRTK